MQMFDVLEKFYPCIIIYYISVGGCSTAGVSRQRLGAVRAARALSWALKSGKVSRS